MVTSQAVPTPMTRTPAPTPSMSTSVLRVVVGSTVVMPACPPRVRRQLEEGGFTVVIVDVSEFHKGGGSIRCLTNPVDVTIGRDLPAVPGGEVVLPL